MPKIQTYKTKGKTKMNIRNIILRSGTFCLTAILGAACFSTPIKVSAYQGPGTGIVKLDNEILKIPKVTESVLNVSEEKREYNNKTPLVAESFDSDVAHNVTSMTYTAEKTGEGFIFCNYGNAKLTIKTGAGNVIKTTNVAKDSIISLKLTQGDDYTLSVSNVTKDVNLLIIEPKDIIDVSSYNLINDKIELKGMTNTYTYTAPETGNFDFVPDSLTSLSSSLNIKVTDLHGNTVKSTSALGVKKKLTIPLTKGEKYTIAVKSYETSDFVLAIYPPKVLDITGYTKVEDSQPYLQCTRKYTYKAACDGVYYFALESFGSKLAYVIKDKDGNTVHDADFITKKIGSSVTLKGQETYSIYVYNGTTGGDNMSSFALYITPQKPTMDVTAYDKIEDSFTFVYQRNNYLLKVDEKGEYTFNFNLTDANATFVNFYIYDSEGKTILSKEYRKKVSPNITKTLEKGTYKLTVRGEGNFNYAMTIQNPKRSTAANHQILDFVRRLYVYVLDREPEQDGLDFWSDELFNFRRTGAEVAQGFIFSPEFENRGTSDEEFLKILYRTFFDREPDSDGMAYWLDQLSSHKMDRSAVANGFIFSQEWADTCASYGIRSGGNIRANETIQPTAATYSFVERMYTTALGREFDADGREYWAQNLANYNITGESVGVAFFLSEEMISYNLSNEEFVNRLYLTFMDRQSDPEGASFWTDLLNSGESRERVVYGFTRSAEFIDKCNDARIVPYA